MCFYFFFVMGKITYMYIGLVNNMLSWLGVGTNSYLHITNPTKTCMQNAMPMELFYYML